MNDNLKKDLENKDPGKDEKGGKEEKQVIEVDAQDYMLLLDRLEELEADKKKGQKKEPPKDDVDDLLEQAKGNKGKPLTFDEMTQSQLVDHLEKRFGAAVNEIQTAIHAIQLEKEFDRMAAQHDDFYDYEKEIFDLMVANPKLSAKQAYRLAKSDAPEKKKELDSELDEDTGRPRYLRSLPDPRKRAFGERPGAAGKTTQDTPPKTRAEAADRAYQDVFKGKDTE